MGFRTKAGFGFDGGARLCNAAALPECRDAVCRQGPSFFVALRPARRTKADEIEVQRNSQLLLAEPNTSRRMRHAARRGVPLKTEVPQTVRLCLGARVRRRSSRRVWSC
jgi:hypothetical protein